MKNQSSKFRLLIFSITAVMLINGCTRIGAAGSAGNISGTQVSAESDEKYASAEPETETPGIQETEEPGLPENAGFHESVNNISPGSSVYEQYTIDKNKWIVNDDKTVSYNGKRYKRVSYIKAILCAGIDRSGEMTQAREIYEAGQADAIFVLAYDSTRAKSQILMISRNTMIPMDVWGNDGVSQGISPAQVCLAFAYGDGYKESCKKLSAAVSDILCGTKPDYYIAADVSIINKLNEQVGGVTVTVPTEGMEKINPDWTRGSTVKLTGSQAESFIRYRDMDVSLSANERMNQHLEYINGFEKAILAKKKENSNIITELYDTAEDYMITDISKGELLKTAADILTGEHLEPYIQTLPGDAHVTEKYDEVYTDYANAIPMILNMFYKEIQ